MDEAPAGNGRAPVRDDEVADGTSPFPGAWTEKSESRICFGRPELQSQAGDRHLGGPGAAGDTPSRSRLNGSFDSRRPVLCASPIAGTSHTACKAGTYTPQLVDRARGMGP